MSFILRVPRLTFFNDLHETAFSNFQKNDGDAIIEINKDFHKELIVLKTSQHTWYILGNLIIPEQEKHNNERYLKKILKNFSSDSICELKGIFYLIQYNCIEKTLRVFSSIMNILPVYYYYSEEYLYISSRIDLLISNIPATFKLNKKHLVERVIFGYGFLNSTPWTGINLLPANKYIEVRSSKFDIKQHTDLSSYFVNKPLPWEKSADKLSDLFISRAKDYFPDKTCYLSLTGGLDSRSLLAIGLFLGKDIKVFSYGSLTDKDIIIPKKISEKIGIEYKPFIIDETFASDLFLKNAIQSEKITEGNMRFSRVHYNAVFSELSNEIQYAISGNFGSELFRTMRMHGNQISQTIFEIFSDIPDSALRQRIKNSERLKYLDKNSLKTEIDELAGECILYRNSLSKVLTPNQRFYSYLFEEVFRKYFGPEIILQQNFLNNRTPFLDFVFIRELLKTELAGSNGDFKTSNPFSRYKGQILYPKIIRKTYPRLLKFELDRGYSPNDFFSLIGKINIITGYIRRKIANENKSRQPDYSKLCFSKNISNLSKIPTLGQFLNEKEYNSVFLKNIWEADYINLSVYLSFFSYINNTLNTYDNAVVE